MEVHEQRPGRRDLEACRRALLRQLDAVHRQIARAEKQLLRVEQRQAALARRRRQLP
jgi:hypothetical protein